jgi:hypothetical protein
MGRIHRYGQRKDCLIFNFVASNTIEGHVLQRLLRDEQDKDKNWHVVERSYGSFSRAIPLPFDPDRRRSRPSSTMACCVSICRNRWR